MNGFEYHCRWILTATVALFVVVVSGCQLAADGQNVKGVQFFQSGNYPAAVEQFQQATRTNPQNSDAIYNLACVQHRIGMDKKDETALKQAEQLYRRCLQLNAEHVDCHRGFAVLLTQTNRQAEAFNLLKNWAIRSPESSEARVELARLYDELGEDAEAERNLVSALRLDRNNARAWLALGYRKEQEGNMALARSNYQRSYQLNRRQPQVAQRIAAISQRLSTSLTPGETRDVGDGSDTRLR